MLEIGKIERIERQIDYIFTDKNKLVQVFTTKSYAKEQKDLGKDCKSQEEYRTQGDSILKNILIELLKKNGYKTPQEISEAKSDLENGVKLAEIFSSFNISSDYWLKGRGERVSIPLRAETFESLICAIFLDISSTSGEELANKQIRNYISKWFEQFIAIISR